MPGKFAVFFCTALAVVSLLSGNAAAVAVSVDFCNSFSNLLTNQFIALVPPEFQALIQLLEPPEADINGNSTIDLSSETVIDIHGNGLRDCDSELALISEVLADPTFNLSASGGVTHDIVYNAWTQNAATLSSCIGTYWSLAVALLPGFQEMLLGYLTIGDGSFTEDPEDVFHVSGSGAFVQGLLEILAENNFLQDPNLKGIENYTRLPQYFAPNGDADGDGFTNAVEYIAFGYDAVLYVDVALDPNRNPGNAIKPNAAFSADVTAGDPPLTVQFTDLSTQGDAPISSWHWQFGDGQESVQQNPSHTYPAGTYTVTLTVGNGIGEDSEVKTDFIVVGNPPQITQQPLSMTVDPGDPLSFLIAATGDEPLGYLWAKNDVAIPTATGTVLGIAAASQGDEGSYTCTVTNLTASVTSNEAQLTVNDPPFITTNPVSRTVDPNTFLNFTVSAAGSPPLSYAWRKDGAPIPDASSSMYVIPSAQQTHEGLYACLVTNTAGEALSAAATLIVNDPPDVTFQPDSLTVDPGDPAQFSVVAIGKDPLSYTWKKGDADVPDGTAATFEIPSAQESDEGAYSCLVANDIGNDTSEIATLTVNDPPQITSQPAPTTVQEGNPASLTIVATGTDPLSYQWRKDGTDIASATLATLQFAPVQLVDQGSYSCLVTNSAGSIASDEVALTVTEKPAGGCAAVTVPSMPTRFNGDGVVLTGLAIALAALGKAARRRASSPV